MSGLLGNKAITQIGTLVHVIEKVVASYASFFGVEAPPITITDEVEQTQTEFQGQRSEANA